MKYVVREFESETDEIIFVGECNLKRRQLTVFARTELVLKLKKYYEKRAKERQIKGGQEKVPQNSAEARDTRDILAEKIRLSNLKQNVTDVHNYAPRGKTRDLLAEKALTVKLLILNN